MSKMTFREMNLRVFEGKTIPHVFFQPRMEPWYAWHKEFGRLPEQCRGKTLLEVYDDLGISMRYVHYYTDMPDPIRSAYTDRVKVRQSSDKETMTTVTETPCGELVQKAKMTVDRTWRTVEFAVKGVDDLKKLRWLYENTNFAFDGDSFEKGSRFVGPRGEPQFWVPKSPYQALCQIWMKLEDFIYALNDAPAVVEETMKAIDDSYDGLYEQMVSYRGPKGEGIKIINFGENIHVNLLNIQYWEKYLVPFYQKRSGQLKRAGIFTHIHIDGYFKPLLKYLSSLPFDGLEALTPLPQGDVSIEEIKEHIGDKVLLDGIPAVLFLPHYPREKLAECVEKLVNLFHPRLILGISDELPEGTDGESVERVRWVADYCRKAKIGR